MSSETTGPILVVNGDVGIRRAICLALENEGYDVVLATSAIDALKILRDGLAPCFILVEVHLPDIDGFEFRRRQLRDPACARFPLVFYGSGSPEANRSIDALGIDSVRLGLDKIPQVVEDHCRRS